MESKQQHILSSVMEGGEAFVIKKLLKENGKPVLHVARNDSGMALLAKNLRFFFPEIKLITFPAWDCLPYDRVSPGGSVAAKRLRALCGLVLAKELKNTVIITTVNSLLQKIIPEEELASSTFYLEKNREIKRDELVKFLSGNGYVNSGTATEAGEFALRGSIVDIIPPGTKEGYRLDFFGDDLEAIRSFNPLTQISEKNQSSLLLMPASEILFHEDAIIRFRQNYRELFGAVAKDDPLYESVSEGRRYAGMEHWLPLFYKNMQTILDYVPACEITFDHLVEEAKDERIKLINDYYDARREARADAFKMGVTYKPIPPDMLYFNNQDWARLRAQNSIKIFQPFSVPDGDDVTEIGQKKAVSFAARSKSEQKNVFDLLGEYLSSNSKKTIITCFSEGSRERMASMLKTHEINYSLLNHWQENKNLKTGDVGLIILALENGFSTDEFSFISEQDLLGEKILRTARKKTISENFMKEASTLMEGDLVVHKEHGIGRFDGLKTIKAAGGEHDCLKIIYDGNDRLFVPVENIDLVTRYGGGEAAPLDRLGGVSWQRRKARQKERIKLAAEELLKIAAERALKQAEPLYPAEGLYNEFCARFPYPETDDQLSAIEDVERDLASGRPMDRLICGDVGFGKTEIALRAAFIASQGENRGQVAIITPTTLLCRQHHQTFKERFAGMNVNIRQLSRMVPAAEATKTRKSLAEGGVDIIIGTHALLNKNLKFRKLSLLIVDEEQHFGVKQKEALKKFRAETHILSLSATPIPRTLQLSLTGVRELSLIATPPVDRLAIRTYVMPFDPVVVREAILREHYRGGRTFYVCPRISDLDELKKKLKSLVPEVKIVVAHGQMPPQELDEIMTSFYEGAYDILLSTSIIESGIDIPTANTMIIHRADMFGLAQLYQIRGRVGRSKVRAYAYLTLPPKRIPTRQALKRLEVMQTLDTLGAGFTLASYDMDIRGFGNLLGEEQSGNIKEVGVELYQQMLEEAVEMAKAEKSGEKIAEREFSPQINIGTSIMIPEDYINDISLRIGLYKRIAHLTTAAEVESIAAEMVDRFGSLPTEVQHLLEVVKLKQICHKCGIEKLEVGPKGAVVIFHKNQFSNPAGLLEYIMKHSDSFKLKPDEQLVILQQNWENIEDRFKGVRASLEQVEKIAA